MPWWAWILAGFAVWAVVYAAFVVALVLLGRRSDARALATFIPDCIVLVSRLARDSRVPRRRKLVMFALVGYLALPFDLVPDFIPVAGQLDDATASDDFGDSTPPMTRRPHHPQSGSTKQEPRQRGCSLPRPGDIRRHLKLALT